jgi:hypothetical protein
MKKRLGNFLVLWGLVSLVLFFTSSTFLLDDAIFFFGGISLLSLGLLMRRSSRKKRGWRKKGRNRGKEDEGEEYEN